MINFPVPESLLRFQEKLSFLSKVYSLTDCMCEIVIKKVKLHAFVRTISILELQTKTANRERGFGFYNAIFV